MSKVVFMFPGQGAQYIGMGKDFYDACEESKAVYELASKVTGLDIAKLCFEENEEINITEYTQIAMLTADMQKEYEAGNYVLCGGDFNHDLKASANEENSEYQSWAYPFPREELPDHFSFCLDQLSEEERSNLWNSARNADMEYVPGETYTVTLDGFIISDNVECLSYENINTGYSYSDHDPVYLEFKLK